MTEKRFWEVHTIKNSHNEYGRRDLASFDNEIAPEEEKEYWKKWQQKQKEYEMSFQ
jgi:hypothetical protein